MRILLVLGSVIGASGVLAAQTTYLYEDHDLSVPGAGWTHEQLNPAAQGWIQSTDLRARHEDEAAAVGACDDRLISPAMDLSAAGAVYVHFSSQINYSEWLANHPNSLGDGENDLWVTTDNGLNWVEVWTDTRVMNTEDWTTVDLSSFAGKPAVRIALRYYGTFSQEWWVDEVIVDDVASNPLPPPVAWTVNLPLGGVQASTFFTCNNLESYAGVLPNFMALTSVDAGAGSPDPEAWSTIAGGTMPAWSGVRNLEMGLRPGSVAYHDVRNALVIGFKGFGAGRLTLDFMGINFGEEEHAADGVWVSADGQLWYRVLTTWSAIPAGGAWSPVTVDLADFFAVTNGQFFLMFQQQDNFPYGGLDGVGIDDLCLSSSGPVGPTLTKTGSCPGLITLEISGAGPSSLVALLYGQAGSFTQTSLNKPCTGIVLELQRPTVLSIKTAGANGVASLPINAPAAACGLSFQAVDLPFCAPSNTITL